MRLTTDDYKLAQIFLKHSLKVKPKEKVLITTSEVGLDPLAKAVYIEALKLGAYPLLDISGIDYYINRAFVSGISYQFYELANEWQLSYIPSSVLNAKIDWADAYVRIVALDNTRELSQIDSDKLTRRMKLMRSTFDKMINSDRWILTYYPTLAMAQEANVSFDWLLDFYYSACLVDYPKMGVNLKKLERAMDHGKEVHIIGDKTDLRLSIAGHLAKACFGERNIPDGEVFAAPIPDSANGQIYFEFPSIYMGVEVRGIYLEFKRGKVVKASAEHGESALQKLLQTDQGAKFLGEFAIGANYNIQTPMRNTLFDEKIGGTVHLALGRAYEEKRGGAPKGGNKSAIHWDIVKDTRKSGSYVEIDGKKVLKDGKILV